METASNGHFLHTTVEGERWDQIAFRYYRDPAKQSVVIRANRRLFVDPLRSIPAVLPAGLALTIPVIDQPPDESLLPPWKRNRPRPA